MGDLKSQSVPWWKWKTGTTTFNKVRHLELGANGPMANLSKYWTLLSKIACLNLNSVTFTGTFLKIKETHSLNSCWAPSIRYSKSTLSAMITRAGCVAVSYGHLVQ